MDCFAYARNDDARRAAALACAAFFTSPRLRGEVGFYAERKIRVRGTLRETGDADRAPHPNPLPAKSGAREHTVFVISYAAFACTLSQNSASRSASRSVAGLASGDATSATSVRSIGAKPSFAVSMRWSAWIAISERILRPIPAATAA
jgi:hypothetical protein